MRRAMELLGGFLIVMISLQSAVRADWEEFKARCRLDFHRNNCWPVPFNLADRNAARSYFYVMADNGWQLQNTLGEYHFSEESNELNTAGVAKLNWIVNSTPLHRRTVFVHRTMSDEATRVRLDSVQQTVAKLLPGAAMPEVLVSDTPPTLTPGFYSDAINRSLRQNIPAPVLPARGGMGSAGGSSGS